jgi:hypothetical protein
VVGESVRWLHSVNKAGNVVTDAKKVSTIPSAAVHPNVPKPM